jgi:hypothetical protein
MKLLHPLLLATILLAACTSVEVRPVSSSERAMELICIVRNPQVIVGDFLGTIEDRIQQHGIATRVIDGTQDSCEYVLTYSATQSWDFVLFLKHAELRIKRGDRIVGSAIYHNRGGFTFTKYAGTKSKMNPVIDELLGQFQPK